ncbi:20616_t:CDS:2, partial [Racocetra persica]
MILIAKLVDEVPAIKVTYEYKESIPAPSVINGCEVFRDNLSYDSDGMCPKYLTSNLSLAEDVRKNASLYNFNRFKRQLMDKTLFTQLGFSPTYKTYYYVTTDP